jgi:hypothetical protein
MIFSNKSKIKESSMSAKVIRADGTVEDLGVVAYYNSNIIKMLFWKIKKLIHK